VVSLDPRLGLGPRLNAVSHHYHYPSTDATRSISNEQQGGIWGMGNDVIFIEYRKENKLLAYKFVPSAVTTTDGTINYTRTTIRYFSRLDEKKSGNLVERDLNDSPAIWGNSNKLIYEED